jgi:hypothetical protein
MAFGGFSFGGPAAAPAAAGGAFSFGGFGGLGAPAPAPAPAAAAAAALAAGAAAAGGAAPAAEPDRSIFALDAAVAKVKERAVVSRAASRALEQLVRNSGLGSLRRESSEDGGKTFRLSWEDCGFHHISYAVRTRPMKCNTAEMTEDMWSALCGSSDDEAALTEVVLDVPVRLVPYGLDGFAGIERRMGPLQSEADEMERAAAHLEVGLRVLEQAAQASLERARELRQSRLPATRDRLLRVAQRFDTFLLGRDAPEGADERALRQQIDAVYSGLLAGGHAFGSVGAGAGGGGGGVGGGGAFSALALAAAPAGGLQGRLDGLVHRLRVWEERTALALGAGAGADGAAAPAWELHQDTKALVERRLEALQKGVERLAEHVRRERRHCEVAERLLRARLGGAAGAGGGGGGGEGGFVDEDDMLI